MTDETASAALDRFERAMTQLGPFMLSSFRRQRDLFGDSWASQFGETLSVFAARDDAQLRAAVKGYVNFALDGMRLQKAFEKTKKYQSKSYVEASQAVYHNRSYMFDMYLPGILLSHYLWPHHYRQFLFFKDTFLSHFLESDDQDFCDIGPGTGFYTRQLLAASPNSVGTVFDISRSALEYCKLQVDAFGLGARLRTKIRDVVKDTPGRQWPFLICIEVLEHLEDPLAFLKALRAMLGEGGLGFISAAVTAPNEDHIYLYNSGAEVEAQLRDAGFKIVSSQEDRAYEPKFDEPVPINAAFIVTV